MFPTTTDQISFTFVDYPVILEATNYKAHQAQVNTSTASCKDHLLAVSEIEENGTADKSNISSTAQPRP